MLFDDCGITWVDGRNALAAALTGNKRERIRTLCASSFAGARDLYEIVVPEMEAMMAAMLSGPGVIGARQAGAGFGGCMVAFVDDRAVDAFAEHVRGHYQTATGIGANVYAVAATDGAGTIPPASSPAR